MEKVPKGIDDIRLAELVLHEGHDVWEVLFADVGSVLDGHETDVAVQASGCT
jgi:hypothetical protein